MQALTELVERAAEHVARLGVVAPELRREVLHRVRVAGEAVAPRHREVLELGEVGVGVRIGTQLEQVEVDLVVGAGLERHGRGTASRRRWVGAAGSSPSHRGPAARPRRPPAATPMPSVGARRRARAPRRRSVRPSPGRRPGRRAAPAWCAGGRRRCRERGVGEDDVGGRARRTRLPQSPVDQRRVQRRVGRGDIGGGLRPRAAPLARATRSRASAMLVAHVAVAVARVGPAMHGVVDPRRASCSGCAARYGRRRCARAPSSGAARARPG